MKEYLKVNRLAECDHLTDKNWHKWKERTNHVFTNCDIIRYVTGTAKQLSEVDNPVGAWNWKE
jgi:hypothetical protein